MYTYTRSKFIAADAQQCFDYLTDPSKMPAWDPNVIESKLVTPGPMVVGSKLQQVRKQGKKEMNCSADVIEHQPYSKHCVRTNIMGINATFAYSFEPENAGTQMSVRAELEGKGLAKLFEGFMGKMCEKVDNDIFDRIASAMSTSVRGEKA